MSAKQGQVGELLDALYLEMFDLIEQQAASRVNIERLSNGGQLLLAKTRYVHGSQSVSVAQIPTENGRDFNALCRVLQERNESKLSNSEYTLVRSPIDKENGYLEPMQWFGVLTPSTLRTAAEQFKRCLTHIVESANIQKDLNSVIKKINYLKDVILKK
ncbi:coiled-coil domain-containing protein 115 [Teleopsis dalmanni]|uniref:coiled-coil domain-containing protein 115 n=1 Tax=Teleopsis dalmanni TaxID=139649 RepID=UPI0018CD4148|nr:coiled-coil domain-containing protein 115 [Teleopsis dalmanni]